MELSLRVSDESACPDLRLTVGGAGATRRQPVPTTAVGASYAFDPGVDGLASIYAARVLERGVDPRGLCADIRADRLGLVDRGPQRRALLTRSRTSRFGRGTAAHLQLRVSENEPSRETITPPEKRPDGPARLRHGFQFGFSRKLAAAAGVAALILLPLGVIVANAQDAALQSRYVVQPGDTLDSVAAEFGVDPASILAASAIENPPSLTPSEIIVIPDPSESPEAAAWNASQLEGTSPFVAGARTVAPGETLASIAAEYGLDPWALAAFNGLADIDTLHAGQRLRIPVTDTTLDPAVHEMTDSAPIEPIAVTIESWAGEESWIEESQWAPESVGGTDPGWEQPATGPVFAVDAPAYQQMYSLSCEYAAAYIATSAFGWGVPESAFMERIGVSANPHWGYRGSIHGAWGGTDDYGVYPEALVPTLNEFGFMADVFYGGDASALTARLDGGMPVITWLGYFGDTAWVQEDEGAYLLAPGMHVVTVYGYDDGGVYVSNPGRGSHDYYTWGDFLTMWSVLDGMALAVAPM
ncbi:MAG TPA: LysM peptidoglycan-binding domain-containing protein [Thermomicrobiales bacterium]|nr:LysM peptidoglycan-binding domain-containing protein [Thermomicrobiales bacterium]